MSSKGGSSGSSGKSSSSYTPYTVNNSGTNSRVIYALPNAKERKQANKIQGNDYDNRSQPSGEAYHYSNTNGSYYYKNSDNSTYYNNGDGSSTYTSPDGNTYKK